MVNMYLKGILYNIICSWIVIINLDFLFYKPTYFPHFLQSSPKELANCSGSQFLLQFASLHTCLWCLLQFTWCVHVFLECVFMFDLIFGQIDYMHALNSYCLKVEMVSKLILFILEISKTLFWVMLNIFVSYSFEKLV